MTYKRWTLVAAVLGSAIVFLDSTVVNVALPKIGAELRSNIFGVLEGQAYVYSGYLLTLSALLILAGALSDFYGRKRMFAVGLVGFGVTSVLCGLAPSLEVLIAARILQGVFGALLVPGSLALISAAFDTAEQGWAYGVWSGASAGTTILGPLIGGVLVDTISWRAAFLINVPIVAVALWAVFAHVRESRDEEATGRFDWLGAAIIAIAVGGLAFGAIYGEQRRWAEPLPFIALGIGAVGLAILPIEMTRAKNPLIPVRLFRSRNFTVTNIATFLIYGALYVMFYNLGLFMQGTLGYTAAAAGLSGVPGTLLLVLFSTKFGSLASKYGPRWFMTAGPALMALGTLWLARLPASSQAWLLNPGHPNTFIPPTSYFTDLLPGLLLFGAGLMMMVAPLTTAVMTSVPSHNSGLASAINNAISRIGPQLGGALIFIAITTAFYASLAAHAPNLDVNAPEVRREISPLNRPGMRLSPAQAQAVKQASSDAFHLAMLASAGLLLAGAVVAGAGIRTQAPEAPAPETPTPEPTPARPAEETPVESSAQSREGSRPQPADQPSG
jgi:EmrB/QacA subfamily drug resistance transporter